MAFTLIELIVAIGIMGVLSALLLSVIQMAWTRVDTVSCLAHLRQLGAAGLVYTVDNGDLLAPYKHSWDGGSTAPLNWKNAFQEYLDEDGMQSNPYKGDKRTRTVSQGCPTFFQHRSLNDDGDSSASPTMLQWGNMGYGYTVRPLSEQPSDRGSANGPLNGNHPPSGYNAAGRLIALSQVTCHSRRAMLVDAFQDFLPYASHRLESIDQTEIGNRRYSAGSPWRHGSGYNIAYFDGHTAFYSGEPLSLPIYSPQREL